MSLVVALTALAHNKTQNDIFGFGLRCCVVVVVRIIFSKILFFSKFFIQIKSNIDKTIPNIILINLVI